MVLIIHVEREVVALRDLKLLWVKIGLLLIALIRGRVSTISHEILFVPVVPNNETSLNHGSPEAGARDSPPNTKYFGPS